MMGSLTDIFSAASKRHSAQHRHGCSRGRVHQVPCVQAYLPVNMVLAIS